MPPLRVLGFEFALSLRRLWRRRTQTGLMLATFTISISLSLLSWSLFHTMFLKNPGFDPKGQLYRIAQTGGMAKDRLISSSREDIAAWKEQQTVFSDFATIRLYESVFVTTEGGQERLLSANVSADALRMVNAQPLMGRLFTPDEDKIGTTPVVILSERTWRNRFAADPNILGRMIKLDGVPAAVVGVMPASFRFPNDQDILQPLGFIPFEKSPQFNIHDVIARLKPGITPGRAVEDLRLITERRGKATMAARFDLRPSVTPFRDYYLQSDMNQSALVLFVLALVFVLVSCANAANLVMIDFLGRTSEIASSLALGVPRSAAIRGLCIQVSVVAVLAAVLSTGFLIGVAPAVHGAMARITTPYWLLFTLEWHHFAMAAALAAVSAGVAIVAPLAYLLVLSPERIIRDGAGTSRGTGRGFGRRALMIGQLALLTVLAVSAGLLLRSSQNVGEEHWGYDARKIFASKTAMKDTDFPTPELRLATHLRLLDEIERLPGVTGAAIMTQPIGFSPTPNIWYATSVDGLADGRSQGSAIYSAVTPSFFTVFGATFLEGETFPRIEKVPAATPTPPAGAGAAAAAAASPESSYAIITYHLAQTLWPGQQAQGREFFVRGQDPKRPPNRLIVRGVVHDFQAAGPKAEVNDAVYMSLGGGVWTASFLYARGEKFTPTDSDIRGAARRVDPRIAIYFSNTMQHVIDTELGTVHLTTKLTTVYALAAVLLCAVGVYSLTVSQILQRNREFGIRMALGIEPSRLWQRFARGHLITAGIGVLVGLGTAVAVVHVLQSLLFGVKARDPITFVVVAAIILFVSALACIPSFFRLQRINPAECLRSL